jgi:hypothetical protein
MNKVSTAKNLNPATALREHQKLTPHRARFTTLSASDRRQNRDRIGQLIGPGSRQESGQRNTIGMAAKERTHPATRPRLIPLLVAGHLIALVVLLAHPYPKRIVSHPLPGISRYPIPE